MLKEILDEWRSIDSDRATLAKFGLVVGSVFLAIGVWQLWRNEFALTFWSVVFLTPGVLLVGFGWLFPGALKQIHAIWMGVAVILGYFMTRVVLTLVFLIAVIPIALALKIIRLDPLDRKLEPDRQSYWKEKIYRDPSPKRLEKFY